MLNTQKSIVTEVSDERLSKRGIRLLIKRDDLIDSEISGNKWRKLKFNIATASQKKNDAILTFGGAFSNHLVATAKACCLADLHAIGLVRGDELNEQSNETLKRCSELGMRLLFVSREEYTLRHERYYHESLLLDHPNSHIVPEGGANYLGMIGCQEILKELEDHFDRIVVAQGTTTTSCGLLMGLEEENLSVVPVLKGFDSISEMKKLFAKSGFPEEFLDGVVDQISVWDQYHFGGYAKYSTELLEFIHDFHLRHQIKLDPVYTGKAMFALFDHAEKGELDGETVLFIHTGGVQGAAGIVAKSGFDLYGEN